MKPDWKRRSQICWGIAMIAGVFLLETWSAHRISPNPASPYVWGVLATAGAAAVIAALRYTRLARAAGRAGVAPQPAAGPVAGGPPSSCAADGRIRAEGDDA